jgi:curved DNA-binding protein CbpA
MNCYDILGVGVDADDAAVRAAYLEAVKRFPPERHPERFAAVSEAYQSLKDEKSRIEYDWFNTRPGAASPMEAVLRHFVWNNRRTPPDFESMKRMLRACAAR